MTYYYKLGKIPEKRHTQFRQADGSLYHEELIGTDGFSGPRSLLYHLRPPTLVHEILGTEQVSIQCLKEMPLQPRHLKGSVITEGGDAITGQVPLLINQDLCVSICCPSDSMDYWFRWALGDMLLFIHEGKGTLDSQFGRLHYQSGDYMVIPAGVLWRIELVATVPQRFLVLEARGHLRPPQRYLNRAGQFSEQAPYCERDLHPPEYMEPQDQSGEFEVRVKTETQVTRYLYHHHPQDVVGWDGYLWPYCFNIHDFEPITGRIHQPPPVHQTFAGPNFVICSFVPRLFDYHPRAIPAPYHHSNVDCDEVLYYADGHIMSRRGIEAGSMTLHPRGLPHGPHPGTIEASLGATETQELAVMIDTAHPLALTNHAAEIEDASYLYSWRDIHPHPQDHRS